MKKIIVLFGGESPEHDVSLRSAKYILKNINKRKYLVIPIVINKNGDWFFYQGDYDNVDSWWCSKYYPVNNIIEVLKDCDMVFPVIHGTYGEDGRLQGMFEMFHIPYVGCSSEVSMICMNKKLTKELVSKKVPVLDELDIDTNKFPVIIKPCHGGSSIGISIAHNKKELKRCISKEDIIIEEYRNVRELEVGVLVHKDILEVTDIGEILVNGLYDYDKKYQEDTKIITKANIPKKVSKKIYKYVSDIVDILSIDGMARIDFFLEGDSIYFNEVNTIPGFTSSSMYPKLFEEYMSPKKLISKLLS